MRATLGVVVTVLALTGAACSTNRSVSTPTSAPATTAAGLPTKTRATPTTAKSAAPATDTTRSTVRAACPVAMAEQKAQDVSGQTVPVTRAVVTHYYAIHGSSPTQLRSQLNQCGPIADGRANDAYTKWFVNWQVFDKEGNGCAVGRVAIHVRVDMYLPQWTDASTPDLQHRWNTYIAALTNHEAGHLAHGFGAAEQVYRTLERLAPVATCAQLDAGASTAARAVLDSFSARDVTYDAQTRHGATQGAIFP